MHVASMVLHWCDLFIRPSRMLAKIIPVHASVSNVINISTALHTVEFRWHVIQFAVDVNFVQLQLRLEWNKQNYQNFQANKLF